MKRNIFILFLAVVLAGLVSYFVTNRMIKSQYEVRYAQDSIVGSITNLRRSAVPKNIPASGTYFSDAAEVAVNTVVYIKVLKHAKIKAPSSVLDLLFGFASTPQDQVGVGSGVIISEDGYIVTNNHVIAGADEFMVTLYDNKKYSAVLVGTDPATDIALLKINQTGLPAIEMGDSDFLRLGEWVLAIGSPYDLRSTITAGIVSAKGRAFPNYNGQYRVESFIQTDAAVNPGNSGGALVNTSGQLVGINTSIISLTGSYAGYSFAVPVNIVKKITDDFINYGEVRRALLGIVMSESENGVIISGVKNGSVADKAGLKTGDILKEINLVKVINPAAVQEQMNKLRPGEKAVLTIERNNRDKEIMVNL